VLIAAFIGFAAALAATLLATPIVRALALGRDLLDAPNHRKVHKEAVPRLGGVALGAGLILGTIGAILLSAEARDILLRHGPRFATLVATAAVLALVGLYDDLRGLSARAKLVAYGIAFWKGATNLQGHVKAGTAMIMEALTSQSGKRDTSKDDALPQLSQYLPGLGELTTFELPPTSPAAGKSLAQLNVRGLTGATILAITRGDQGIIPAATEELRPGDRLALAGTREAVAAATDLLEGNSDKAAD